MQNSLAQAIQTIIKDTKINSETKVENLKRIFAGMKMQETMALQTLQAASVAFNKEAFQKECDTEWQTIIEKHSQAAHKDTPLIAAARLNEAPCLRVLLDAKANIEATNLTDGETALMVAAVSNNDSCVRLLLEAKANPNTDNKRNGLTALIYAAESGSVASLNELIKHGAALNHKTNLGETALMIAASYGREEHVDILLKAGASTNIVSLRRYRDGKELPATALAWAIEREKFGTIALLFDYNAPLILHAIKSQAVRFDTDTREKLNSILKKQDAKDPRVSFCKGIMSEREQNIKEAETYYLQAVNHAPSLRRSGEIAEKNNQPVIAINRYGAAMKLNDKEATMKFHALAKKLADNKEVVVAVAQLMSKDIGEEKHQPPTVVSVLFKPVAPTTVTAEKTKTTVAMTGCVR